MIFSSISVGSRAVRRSLSLAFSQSSADCDKADFYFYFSSHFYLRFILLFDVSAKFQKSV
jgi:hypothetical protein